MPGDYSIPNRITVLETKLDHYSNDLNELADKIDKVSAGFIGIDKKLEVIITQREEAEKRLSRWKSGAITLITSLTVALIIFLVKIAYIVQTSKLTSF